MNQDALLASERLCFPSALAYPLCLLTLVGMGFGSVEKKKDILCNHFGAFSATALDMIHSICADAQY